MPGHKGGGPLGFEDKDITEIPGADSLFEADGIIAQSEQNASNLFGCHTLYSTEGSSHVIRAMLFLALQGVKNPVVAAGRNAHKAFLTAAALLDFKVDWLSPSDGYLDCQITPQYLREYLKSADIKPNALYVTSPDYLGNTLDIAALAEVAKEFSLPLLVDNAHGAYLKFLPKSKHPMDLGAAMCADSAHKTLPVITGGAYLHISPDFAPSLLPNAKSALSLFGSTSPSYLILQSLDGANLYLDSFKETLKDFLPKIADIKTASENYGYEIIGDEPMKITLNPKPIGYTGDEVAKILQKGGIVAEFFDPDYITLMPSPCNNDCQLEGLKKVLLSLPKKASIETLPPKITIPKRAISPREAIFSAAEEVMAENSFGRIAAMPTVGCPPAVPIIISGEIIDEKVISAFKYYEVKTVKCVKR